MEYYVVGEIKGTHGLKGDLKVKNLSDFDRFLPGKELYILFKNQYIKVIVCAKRATEQGLLVRFKDLEDINLVEHYRGSFIYIEKNDMGELPNDEYYYHELIGKEIINDKGLKRGPVVAVREVPGGHLLVVSVAGKNKLVPFKNEFIIKVNDDSIIINEIEGLL